jgi:hypothetical protein
LHLLAQIKASKFCLAPYGHGWGIRTNIYMAHGCVPVIVQAGAAPCALAALAVLAALLGAESHCHAAACRRGSGSASPQAPAVPTS